jgi:hypothetical protein
MIYPVRLVKALPLVFSVGADHDSVTFVGDVVAPEEPDPLVATGVEAIGVLPVPVVGSVPALAGGVTAATLLASDAEPALCVEPPHADSRTTARVIAPRIWVMSFQRRSVVMCIRLANEKALKALWRLRIDRREAD